ncbi:hypothetical protein KDW_31660 [Dictyobacter vulcani]|uniref:Uncharacterized protein n=1 Tax=Dictyobacter vulcani TaxID=2607529 RepID=A0A5J4KHQ1_9CHLR|nr:hypothetical protein [Dictyobacter vulcani]GER89004.1 hypothetical protein KDW_31660 [Dictyobacter vulcani]
MESYDANGYTQWIRSLLEKLEPALESQLQTIVTARFHPHVVLLDTEVFPDGLREGVPLRMFLLDAHNSEVFHHDATFFLPSSIGLLEAVKEVIPPSEEDRQKLYEEAGVETIEIEMSTLIEWFVACWMRAGGQHVTLPAYICRHDDQESFDLHQMKWVADQQGKHTHFLPG